jgi:hypothetical protein
MVTKSKQTSKKKENKGKVKVGKLNSTKRRSRICPAANKNRSGRNKLSNLLYYVSVLH